MSEEQSSISHFQENPVQKPRVKRKIGVTDEKVKYLHGLTYSIKKLGALFTGNITIPLGSGNKNWMVLARTESDLPQEIVEKYMYSCIPDEELYSILGDEFTLYFGFVRESSVNAAIREIIAESFESLLRGGMMVEHIDILQGQIPCWRIVQFKWNGIVIHEEEGSPQVSFKRTQEDGQSALIAKLGRRFYTVKAKKSFFNKGLPPKCQDESKLDEVLRVVKTTDLPDSPKVEDVKQFIEGFFQENTHLDLVFGPDSPGKEFWDSIKKYAAAKDFGLRYFKSSQNVKQSDNLVMFIKRSPFQVRERLKKLPGQQDLKFYLIPPCEQGKPYQQWSSEWVRDHVPDESVYTPGPSQKFDNKRKLDSSNPALPKSSSDSFPAPKRTKEEVSEVPPWEETAPLIILWPITIRSKGENDLRRVLEENFPTEVATEASNTVSVFVTLPLRDQSSKRFCVARGTGVSNVVNQAFDTIARHSSVIKYTPQYLPPGGETPDFIRDNIPCDANPRTYILVSKNETGPLTHPKIMEIFHNLKISYNEEVFFDSYSYTYEEKQTLLELAPKNDLKVRHFGDDQRLANRYVCVYKRKPKDVILEEVLRKRNNHPKYMLASDSHPHPP